VLFSSGVFLKVGSYFYGKRISFIFSFDAGGVV